MSARCLLRHSIILIFALAVTACALHPSVRPVAAPPPAGAAAHVGTAYEIAAGESLLIIRVYKAGALAAAGHNHILASHALTGTIYVPADPLKTSFEVHLPVTSLTVDEAALRAQEHSDAFPGEVPDSAKEGTRRNMLSEALLDGAHFPEIVLRAVSLQQEQPPAAGTARAQMQAVVREEAHDISVPVHYQLTRDAVIVSGESSLKQSDLGLKPFSALLGALQVQDEMQVSFRIVAHAGGASAAH